MPPRRRFALTLTRCTAPAAIHVSTIRVTSVRGWYRSGCWLVTRRGACLGDCGGVLFETVPVLVAEVGGGRVSSIVFVVGAQGE
jgi:hypothetical protein